MSKKLIILSVIVLVLGAFAGGFYFLLAGNTQGEEKEKNQQFQGPGLENVFSEREDLIVANIDDLVIGEKVTVRGTLNQDGSITAETVYIGSIEEGFQQISNFSPDRKGDSAKLDRPTLPEGMDPEELMNLSPEERRAHMEKFLEESDPPKNGIVRGQGGTGFSRGEILDKDEVSITLKLIEGGSQLVFYSNITEIFKIGEKKSGSE